MALQVIGSGLGRTGTKSLQTALNMLGAGPCHHMAEVFPHPRQIELWTEAGDGHADWEAIFEGYRAAVDYPSAAYWRELAAYYPDAKVIHTVRDPQAWFDSTQATIFAPDGPPARALAGEDVPMAAFFRSFAGPFVGRLHDRDLMVEHFVRHTEAVKAEIPAERLLIYEAGQGWAPLCRFLDLPVPQAPYPSENSRAEFIGRTLAARGGAAATT